MTKPNDDDRVLTCSVCGQVFPAPLDVAWDAFTLNMTTFKLHVDEHQREINEALRTGEVRMTAREARFTGGEPARLAEGLPDDEVIVFHTKLPSAN